MKADAAATQRFDAQLEELGAILAADERVRFAYLFGSWARGDATLLSDVDIAVHLTAEADPLETPPELAARASIVLQTEDVDLVILDRAPISFRYRVVRDRRVLADRDPAFRIAFESRTLREGWDFARRERTMLGLADEA